MVEGARPQQAHDDPRPLQARRPDHPPAARRHRRRRHRELPPRHPGEMGPGLAGAVRRQPSPGPRPGHRLRPVRPVRSSPRLRHPRRGDERLRRDHRRTGRAPDAAALRPRRLDRGPGDGVRGHDGAGARDRTGEGQVVDMAIIEPILSVLGPQPLWYDQLGHVQPRTGNRSQNNAPATPTAPPTAPGSPCRRRPSRSPNA